MYAALSMGIVVTYQGTGVINFAAAAMATVPLYVFSFLQEASCASPCRGCRRSTWAPRPRGCRVVIALLVAAVLGALVHVLVSKPLRTAPVLAKVVAAVGIMLTLQAGIA